MNDTNLIKSRMNKYNLDDVDMARILECSERTFTNKLFNRKKQNAKDEYDVCGFNTTELQKIIDVLHISKNEIASFFFVN